MTFEEVCQVALTAAKTVKQHPEVEVVVLVIDRESGEAVTASSLDPETTCEALRQYVAHKEVKSIPPESVN